VVVLDRHFDGVVSIATSLNLIDMSLTEQVIPPGPAEKYDPADNILDWLMKNLREHGGVYRAFMYGAYVYVVSDPRHVDHILRENWQNYRKGQAIKRVGMLLGNGLMVSEGEFWKTQRRLMQPAFHGEVIGKLVGLIEKTSRDLLSRWMALAQQDRSINVTREVSLWVLEVVLRGIFGDDFDAVAPAFSVLSSESARDLQFAQAFRPVREVLREVIGRRRQRADSEMDILGMLMAGRDRATGQTMPDGQMVNEIVTLIVAGHETTASTLSWVWFLLSQHPEVETRLSIELLNRGDPVATDPLAGVPYLRQVIDEAMRLYPPGWLMTRRALKDDRIGEYCVPAGTEVYISPYLIHRNPALWKNPELFDPDRFAPGQIPGGHPLAHIPFSAGPRKCIGDVLAWAEMQIHIATVVPHLRLRWTSGNPDELEPGVNLRCRNDLRFTGEMKAPVGLDPLAMTHADRSSLPPLDRSRTIRPD
jgi:cytochrome P450